jgi:phage gp36-like protein
MYATPADMAARYRERLLAELTGATNGTPDPARLDTALADATGEIDAYLADRYLVPLANPPGVIVRACVDIAVYRLWGMARSSDVEDIRKRYEDVVRLLKLIASGDVVLDLPEKPVDPATGAGGGVFIGGPAPRLGGNLGEFV